MGFCYLLTGLLAIGVTLTECTSYYQPSVKLSAGTRFSTNKVGVYAPYTDRVPPDVHNAALYLVEDGNLGCPNYNASNTTTVSFNSISALLTPLNGGCSDFERAQWAASNGAAAVIFYYFSDSQNQQQSRSSRKLPLITIAAVRFEESEFNGLKTALADAPASGSVTIEGDYHRIFQKSQTFYFVVFAFCILMTLSCLWFAMSYIKKFRYSMQARRRRAETRNEVRRVMSSLPVRSHKVSKATDELTCAVCLEAFRNKDAIRTLPCDHEFHKKCIDPWIKIKRTCPMCKQNISENIPHGSRRRKTNRHNTTQQRPASARDSGVRHPSVGSIESGESALSTQNMLVGEASSHTGTDTSVEVVLLQPSLDMAAAVVRGEEGEGLDDDRQGQSPHVAVLLGDGDDMIDHPNTPTLD